MVTSQLHPTPCVPVKTTPNPLALLSKYNIIYSTNSFQYFLHYTCIPCLVYLRLHCIL
jgi:hypothetical protein